MTKKNTAKKELVLFNKATMKKGDCILAKMRGYDHWPALVIDFVLNSAYAPI